MRAFVSWLEARRSLVAVAVAAYAVWRVARWILSLGWSFGGWRFLERAAQLLQDQWALAAAALALVFVATFAGVRAAIGGIDRRQRRREARRATDALAQ